MAPARPRYVPVLKTREAEIKALMRAPAKLALEPVFELQKASPGGVDRSTGEEKRAKRSPTDASYFLDDVARLWSGPMYVDVGRVASGSNRQRWWALLAAVNDLAPAPAELMPVLVPSSGRAERSMAGSVAKHTGRAALRVDMSDARRNPSTLSGIVPVLAADAGLQPRSVDILLDWADTTERSPLDDLVRDTLAVMNALGSEYGHVATLGTPDSRAFAQAGDWAVARREWWLWLRLVHSGHSVDYGDYALYPPSDPVPAAPRYGHLRYSSDDLLHVHRRVQPASGGGLGAAFRACCAHVVGQPYWLGSGFSGADRRIDDIAAGADKETSPGKWRQIAAEHHFALVAQQLNAIPPSPPTGTA